MNWLQIVLGAALAAAGAAAGNPYLRRRVRSTAAWNRRWLQVPIAVVLGGLAGLAGSVWEFVGFLVLAIGCSLLVVVDLADWELPDVITLSLYPVLGLALTAAAWAQNDFGRLGRAGLGAVLMFGLYFLLARVAPDLGFGDVKLAGVLGGFLGWLGLSQWTLGFLAAWVSMAVISVLLLATKRITRQDSLPFGPWMILGAALGALLGPVLLPALA